MEKILVTWDRMDLYTSVPIEYRFIDTAEVIPGQEAWGNKAVSSQDWYFTMHFPGNPVMPGVLLMEVLQQTGLLAVTSIENMKEKVMLFQGCKNMRMFHSVRPGDLLKTHVVLDRFRHGIGEFHGEAVIERLGEEKSLKACTMEFTMVLKSQFVPVAKSFDDIESTKGRQKVFDYSNFDVYLADPIEYRFIDLAEAGDAYAYGRKNTSSQDWYFKSFLPGDPMMPVGFIMEAIMQTGVLLVTQKEEIKTPLMMFNSCRNIGVYDVVRPGDILNTKVVLKSFRGGVADYIGSAQVGEKMVCRMKFVLIHPDEIQRLSNAIKKGTQ